MERPRTARVQRNTKETEITVELVVPSDGTGRAHLDVPVPFLAHMLDAMTRHGAMDLSIFARGDTEVDDHHTVEDLGLVIGQALDEALGDRAGITRFGHFSLVMDETLVDCAVDLGGRPYLRYDLPALAGKRIGHFDADLLHEFFRALVVKARMNLHLSLRAGGNAHHVAEAACKAAARALKMACAPDPFLAGVPSTKGVL